MSMTKKDVMERWQRISDFTRFDAGDEFTSEQQVRKYFQRKQLRDRVCVDANHLLPCQHDLDDMAHEVIVNRWHCAF